MIYMLVAFVLTGMCQYEKFKANVNEPLSVAMNEVHLKWAALIVAFGAIVPQTAVLLVFQIGPTANSLCHVARPPAAQGNGQNAFAVPHAACGDAPHGAVCRRGIGGGKPRRNGRSMQYRHTVRLHHRLRWRYRAPLAGVPRRSPRRINVYAAGTSFGPAAAAGSKVRCCRAPSRSAGFCSPSRGGPPAAESRGFRTPLVPLFPLLGVVSCLWLSFGLPIEAWVRFIGWLIIGLVFYLIFGSFTRRGQPQEAAAN